MISGWKNLKMQSPATPTHNHIIDLRYFKLSEFAFKCCGSVAMNEEFLLKLDRARAIAKIPFIVTSGYRCEKHNRAIGSLDTSSHLKGRAADIACTSDRNRYLILVAAIASGIKRIGVYKTFLHLDYDRKKTSRMIWYG